MQASTRASQSPTSGPTNAQVAHELANLLDGSMRNVNLVRAFLKDQAESSVPTDPDVTQRLQSAEQGMRQMATLLRRWLHTTHPSERHRAETDSFAFDVTATNLGQAVAAAVQLLTPIAFEHDVVLNLTVDPTASELPAGPIQFVVTNAVRNAIESLSETRPELRAGATSESTKQSGPLRVDIEIKNDGEHLLLHVNDNGPGIAPELLDKHGDCLIGATTKPYGHGIGLTVCHDMAKRLGGTIRLTNRDGGGAVFALHCPSAALKHQA